MRVRLASRRQIHALSGRRHQSSYAKNIAKAWARDLTEGTQVLTCLTVFKRDGSEARLASTQSQAKEASWVDRP